MSELARRAALPAAWLVMTVAATGFLAAILKETPPARPRTPRIDCLLLDQPAALAARDAAALARDGFEGVVIDVTRLAEGDSAGERAAAVAAGAARAAGLSVSYWIEVGRDPRAAAENPRWLHRPHEIAFYGGDTVVIPDWVSINNREVFDHELERVTRALRRAGAQGDARVYLNDLLGPPEGCGCGNVLCRLWDNSLGAKVALGEGPAAFGGDPIAPSLFCESVEKRFAGLVAVPVITEECEAGVVECGIADPETAFAFGRMLCTRPDALESYPRLIQLLAQRPAVALLTLDRTFGRDAPEFGPPGAWVGAVLDRYRGYDPRQTLFVVVEGWELGMTSVLDRVRIAEAHGARGAIVAACRIDQSWRVLEEKHLGAQM